MFSLPGHIYVTKQIYYSSLHGIIRAESEG
jgi:hypothetical protein